MSANNRKILLFIAFLTCLALVAVALFFLDDIFSEPITEETGEAVDIEKEMNTVYIDGTPYVRRPGVENYVIFGIDAFGKVSDAGVAQADFIMVLSFDRLKGKCTMVAVNRDTMMESDVYDALGNKMGTEYRQIALSHASGSSLELSSHAKCQNTEKTVSKLLHGVKFDGYISMTMDAIVKVVDCIGGVEMYMEEDLTATDDSFIKGETVLLDGELAVKFIRARGGLADSSNIARMKRQEAFLKAFFEKLNNKAVSDNKLLECFDSTLPHMVTNMNVNGLDVFIGMLLSYEKNDAVTLPGEAKIGDKYMEFYVDEEGLMDIVTEHFFDGYDEKN